LNAVTLRGDPSAGGVGIKGEEMTELEQLIEEIRERLKGSGPIDPMAAANELVEGYSFSTEEICALVIEEADALKNRR
jgi:hypothetical protein